MKLLITGANGQLGRSIKKASVEFPEFEFQYTDLPELDITNLKAIQTIIANDSIDVIINCAAYTAVDKAEEDSKLAFLINKTGPANLAIACNESKCSLLHISTDYVFSGKAYRPYLPSHPTDPISIYAQSKEAGESSILKTNPNGWIIRTSWLYSEFGQNFVKTMMRLGKEREQLNIIADQIGSPCYAYDLANTILSVVKHNTKSAQKQQGTSIYHYSNSGCASWFDFTKSIMELSGIECKVNPITTEMYPLPATRPFYSVLNTESIVKDFDISIPYWKDSLKNCIDTLLSKEEG